MDLHRISLKFKEPRADLETLFHEAYFRQNLFHLRAWYIIAWVAVGSAGYFDAVLFPQLRTTLWAIRYACIIPFFMVAFVFTWSPLYARCWQGVNFFHVMTTGISAVACMAFTEPPLNALYHYSIAVTLLFGYAFIRERFIWAATAGWSLFAIYQLASWFGLSNPLYANYLDSYVLAVFNLLGMAIAYGVEYTARKNFLLSHTLKLKNQQLNQENFHRRQTAQQLKASLDEKEVLLKEIHHRVKNNLQIVSSLLDMTRFRTNEPTVAEALLAARSKIETMAMIHTQLYRKDQSAHVDLVKHIQHLYHNLLSLFGMGRQIDFRLQAAGIHLPVEKAVPCALILNELLSNALKHAFKCRGSGQIHVVCELKASGILQITVRDNGIGMPRELDLDTTKSLGLKLVRILTKEQLAGEVLTNNDGGAVVTIRFQISPRMKAMSKAIHRRVSYPEKHQ